MRQRLRPTMKDLDESRNRHGKSGTGNAGGTNNNSGSTITTPLLSGDDSEEGERGMKARTCRASVSIDSYRDDDGSHSTADRDNACLVPCGVTKAKKDGLIMDDTKHDEDNRDNNNNNPRNSSSSSSPTTKFMHQIASYILTPLLDETGSPIQILTGLSTLFLLGVLLGLLTPADPSLPTKWYRHISSIIGYTYFVAWSISFYPQVITNYRRKSTRGLSYDFCLLNLAGFTCYSVYNACLFWSPTARRLYRRRYDNGGRDEGEGGGEEDDIIIIPVQSNDVAFAFHAWVLSGITVLQILHYDRRRHHRHDTAAAAATGATAAAGNACCGLKMPSPIVSYFIIGVIATCIVYAIIVALHSSSSSSSSSIPDWLDYLYLLSSIKVIITLIKYIPQVILNHRRKSTSGWNIWNVVLDFTGGVLSVSQLVGDCADSGDWMGITGNLAKFFLGFVSIMFDIIFILQHYVLYPNRDDYLTSVSAPLILQDDYEVL